MPTPTRTAELSSQLRIGVMRLARRLRSERADLSLSLNQLAALSTLDRHGMLTPGELAAYERVQPPSMTRILATLEGRGLVERTAHPTDGRQVLVANTAAATTLLREDRRRRDLWLSRRLAELSPADRETLRAAAGILDRLSAA